MNELRLAWFRFLLKQISMIDFVRLVEQAEISDPIKKTILLRLEKYAYHLSSMYWSHEIPVILVTIDEITSIINMLVDTERKNYGIATQIHPPEA